MSERTSMQLEREAEQIREGIAQTAEALQDRMSPGKMIDEFMTYMKDSDGTLALDNLRRQARDNPMALALIGSGVAWLMFGSGGRAAQTDYPPQSEYAPGSRYDSHAGAQAGYRPERAYGADYLDDGAGASSDGDKEPGGLGRAASAVGDAASGLSGGISSAASAVGDAASGLSEKAGGLVDRARGAAGHASDRARGAAQDAADRARRLRHDAADRGYAAAGEVRNMADRGRRTLMDALDREPLVLGAIGVAVGAAIGAMLPSTRFEDETFGKTRDALMHGAEKVVDRAAETARSVAGEALEAAKSASKDEGLVIEGKAVAERVGEVAKAALAAGKDAVQRDAGLAGEQESATPEANEQPVRS